MKKKSTYNKITNLTYREIEVVCLIIDEKTTKEMAQSLYVSVETIKSHRKNIKKKLHVKNVAGIVREAFMQNLIGRTMLPIGA
jgi:DNA-binding CsgD family transcriptional regulator